MSASEESRILFSFTPFPFNQCFFFHIPVTGFSSIIIKSDSRPHSKLFGLRQLPGLQTCLLSETWCPVDGKHDRGYIDVLHSPTRQKQKCARRRRLWCSAKSVQLCAGCGYFCEIQFEREGKQRTVIGLSGALYLVYVRG